MLLHLVDMQYSSEMTMTSSGPHFGSAAMCWRFSPLMKRTWPSASNSLGDEIEKISEIDPLTGKVKRRIETVTIYPSSHHVTPEEVRFNAIETIKSELKERMEFL